MTATVVRYQTRPEAGDENQRLIEAVFACAAVASSGSSSAVIRIGCVMAGTPRASPSSRRRSTRAASDSRRARGR